MERYIRDVDGNVCILVWNGHSPYQSCDFCYVPLTAAATHQSWNCMYTVLFLPLCIVLYFP